VTAPAPSLRDRIAAAIRPWVLDSGSGAEEAAAVDAVLPLLAAEREAAADLAEDVANEFFAAYDTEQGNGAMAVAARLRARADTTHPGGRL
jgi:hypothetical protein